jgi:hypothetical protein
LRSSEPSSKFARDRTLSLGPFSDKKKIAMLLRAATPALVLFLAACSATPEARAPKSAAPSSNEKPATKKSAAVASKGDVAHHTKVAARARPKRKRGNQALSPEQVREVRLSADTKMAGCYEIAPAKEASASGMVKVEFEVTTAGMVKNEAIIENTLADSVLGDCVLDVVRRTTFPETTAPTGVSWALRFRGR